MMFHLLQLNERPGLGIDVDENMLKELTEFSVKVMK